MTALKLATALPIILALIACGEPPTSPAAPVAAAPEAAPPVAPVNTQAASVEGWDNSATTKQGQKIPDFELDKFNGGKMQAEELRGHWTVLALWSASSPESIADENYIRAVVSAADQDPDLDFLSIHVKTDASADPAKLFKGKPWPAILADDKASATFGVSTLPAYLLVGPDLTIEASRGPLAKTPEDGIKGMFRGIAEIRKQVAAPG